MDPLAEKYYDLSPYTYCASNPSNYVDIQGEAIWEVSRNGSIQRKENSEDFILYSIDTNGERVSKVSLSGEGILMAFMDKSKKYPYYTSSNNIMI